jgi:hypothetical protein
MESPNSDHQAIQDPHDDHVENDRQYDKMIITADPRATGQAEWKALDERWVDGSGLQQDSLRTIPAGRPHSRSFTQWQMGSFGTWSYLFLLIASFWIIPASAVFVEFQNCLSEGVQNNLPPQLQLVPLVVNAVFNTTDPSHNLNLTVWTNVTGSTVAMPRLLLPAANSSYWDPGNNDTTNGGKIADNPFPNAEEQFLTTLFSKVNVLTYSPYNPKDGEDFCHSLVNATCPVGPNFKANL